MILKRFIYAAATAAVVTALFAGYGNMKNTEAAVYAKDSTGYVSYSENDVMSEEANDEDLTLMASGDFTYEFSEEDESSIVITGYTGSATKVVIPSTIDGYPVIEIGNWSFAENTSITSVVISEGVANIESWAFGYCSSLKSIELPNSVTSIGNNAFSYCSSLKSIELPDNLEYLGIYPGDAFEYCDSLTSVSISEDNKNFSTQNGAIFNKDKTVLYYHLAGQTGTYTVPSGVTTINDCAFKAQTGLTKVYLPDSVTTIKSCAFENCFNLTYIEMSPNVTEIEGEAFLNCSNLTSIVIPSGITVIKQHLLANCSSLTDIYYVGTKTQWNSLSFGTEWKVNCSSSLTVHYVNSATGQSKGYTGILKSTDGNWYYWSNGVFRQYNGIVKNTSGNGKWYYVKNGVFTTYTGKAKIAGSSSSKTYKVVKGLLSN